MASPLPHATHAAAAPNSSLAVPKSSIACRTGPMIRSPPSSRGPASVPATARHLSMLPQLSCGRLSAPKSLVLQVGTAVTAVQTVSAIAAIPGHSRTAHAHQRGALPHALMGRGARLLSSSCSGLGSGTSPRRPAASVKATDEASSSNSSSSSDNNRSTPPPPATEQANGQLAPPSSPSEPDLTDAAALAARQQAAVAEALQLAMGALEIAESSLDKIPTLASAFEETLLQRTIKAAIAPATFIAACAACIMSHGFGLWVQWASAAAGGGVIALSGVRKGSLSQSGAIAALMVGTGTLGCSLRLGATLLAFFFSSSKLTQYKEELKQIDDSGKKGGQRDWLQVACNGLVPTILAITYGVLVGCVDVPLGPSLSVELWRSELVTALMAAYLGYYSCCCGDTWASELGPLSSESPRLITTMRPVRRGTNGGVTVAGLLASVAGGMFIGCVFYAAALVSPTLWVFPEPRAQAATQWKLIPLGLFAGLFGSLLDSVLGATLQFSGYNTTTGLVTSKPGPGVQAIAGLPFLTNNAVNAVSATCTAMLTAFLSLKSGMFGF